MNRLLSAFAVAALCTAPAMASESWTEIPMESGPLHAGTVLADRGGDAQPEFGAGRGGYDLATANVQVVIVAEGDGYNVTPRDFLPRSGDRPVAVASATRPNGG
ncbi:MAG: hypothetical protein MUC89_05540 [Acetobacteraceae bacterium]|jgi:hypothetical protein|nr:hypothetical protein [Acetobacteraceae bacterium]